MKHPELKECRILRIEPGDIVVFETEDKLTSEQVQTLKRQLETALTNAGHAGVPTMIIAGGTLVKTQVVSPERVSPMIGSS